MYIKEWFEADEDFEFGERDGDFGFVILVAEFGGFFLVEARCEVFVGVDLEGQGFGD